MKKLTTFGLAIVLVVALMQPVYGVITTPELSNILVSPGNLTFVASTHNYEMTLAYDQDQISIQPVVPISMDLNTVRITINGILVVEPATGTVIEPVVKPLDTELNVFNIVVMSEIDETVKSTYTLNITRKELLTSMTVSVDGVIQTLSPGFDSDTHTYTTSVASEVQTVRLASVLGTQMGYILKINGTTYNSLTMDIPVNYGKNPLTIGIYNDSTVGALPIETYQLTIKRPVPLASLTISPITFNFNPLDESYALTVANTVTKVRITPVAVNVLPAAMITINDKALPLTGYMDMPLNVGKNNVKVKTIYNDVLLTYNIVITRALAPNPIEESWNWYLRYRHQHRYGYRTNY